MKRIPKFKNVSSDDILNKRLNYLKKRSELRQINKDNILIPSDDGFYKTPLAPPDFLIRDIEAEIEGTTPEELTKIKKKFRDEMLKLAPLTIVDSILADGQYSDILITQLMALWPKFKKDLLKNFSTIDVSTFNEYVKEYLSGEKIAVKSTVATTEKLIEKINDKLKNNQFILDEKIMIAKEKNAAASKIQELLKRKQLMKDAQDELKRLKDEANKKNSPAIQQQIVAKIQQIDDDTKTEVESIMPENKTDIANMEDFKDLSADNVIIANYLKKKYKNINTVISSLTIDVKGKTPTRYKDIIPLIKSKRTNDKKKWESMVDKKRKQEEKEIFYSLYPKELFGEGMKKKKKMNKKNKVNFDVLLGEVLSGNDNKQILKEYKRF